MEFIEKTLEMRAVRRDEIIDYFINISGEDKGHGRITGKGWEAEVGQEKLVALGSLAIPAVIIMLRCEKELFEQIYSDFCSKFLRAGG